ncbi:MAG: bifunctional glutamate N-acetyltransferase/amino-acid acetyltransferase ArgJ [Candidatus Omnitrophica bacterium]|nr:bifunctional glutamate N-acetyltransferase/amino-acid acetyltransferase ArgJ [Candidatus Omnitrophota bacterium]
MKVYKKAILPKGFKASAVACGIKRQRKLDLALFYSELPAKTAAKFTTNKIEAAHIKVDKRYLKHSKLFQAIAVNSGNANCFTGSKGEQVAGEFSKSVARALQLNKNKVLVASTGIIGKPLAIDKIKKSVPELVSKLSGKGVEKAKNAILTTDSFAKTVTVKFNIGNQAITLCGVAKGAGMIAPDMATMLSFIFTDANITQGALNKALGICVKQSFNCITVDGCMSTNDSVILLANGASGSKLINSGKSYDLFLEALNKVSLELAKMIVKDGEGASKFIEINVKGANNFSQAKRLGLNIANSNLFKTEMFGENPNFGRIIAAAGASGIGIKEKNIRVKLSSLKKKDISVLLDIKQGKSSATVFTSDLTPKYIKINAEYN